MTTLRLLVDLLLIAPRLALAWLKTKLPSRSEHHFHCKDCGWGLRWDTASMICSNCQEARRTLSQ